MTSSDWSLFPHGVLFQSGFPAELRARFGFPRATAALADVNGIEGAAESLAVLLLGEGFHRAVVDTHRAGGDRATLRALSRARSKVGRRRRVSPDVVSRLDDSLIHGDVARWNALLDRRETAMEEARRAFDEEQAERREALRSLVQDPRFAEGLLTTNPNLVPGAVSRWLRAFDSDHQDASARRMERVLTAYLQRGTSKTHVSSWFGLIDYATVDPSQAGTIEARIDADGPRPTAPAGDHRDDPPNEVFFSFWAAEALSGAIAADPDVLPHLRPRLNPVCRLAGRQVEVVGRERATPVDPEDLALLSEAKGELTVAELAAVMGRPLAVLVEQATTLAAEGWLLLEVPLPSTVFHPLDRVASWVRARPADEPARDRWLTVLEHLEELRLSFRDGALADRVDTLAQMEEIFTAATGLAARRGAGRTYADRLLVYEERRGRVPECRLGRSFAESVEQRLGPALHVCAAYGVLCRRHYRSVASEIYDSSGAGPEGLAFGELTALIQRRGMAGEIPLESEDMSRYADGWARLVADRTSADGHLAVISRDDVAPLTDRLDHSAHVALDLLVAAPSLAAFEAGEYQLVVGEVGENVMLWGSQFYFHPRRSDAEASVAEVLGALPSYDPMAMVVPRRVHKGFLNECFPGLFVEAFGRLSGPPERIRPFRDLRVVRRDGELVLTAPGHERLQFFHHHDELVHLWAFAGPRVTIPPLPPAAHHPRIEVEGCVLRREQWMLGVEEIGPTEPAVFGRFVAARALAERRELPDLVFVHPPSEDKPVLIDLTSALSVDLLHHLWRDAPAVRAVEVYPGPGDLWVADTEGHYASEFQFLLTRP